MRLPIVVPTLLVILSLFFTSAGVGLRSIYRYAPIYGIVLGIILLLFAGKAADWMSGNK